MKFFIGNPSNYSMKLMARDTEKALLLSTSDGKKELHQGVYLYSFSSLQRQKTYQVIKMLRTVTSFIFVGYRPVSTKWLVILLVLSFILRAKRSLLLTGCSPGVEYFVQRRQPGMCEACMKHYSSHTCRVSGWKDTIILRSLVHFCDQVGTSFVEYKKNRFIAEIEEEELPIPKFKPCISSGQKVNLLIGITRRTLKGSDYFIRLLSKIENRNDINVNVSTLNKVSFDQFEMALSNCDIYFDQYYSISLGMAARFALEKGKIVVTGCREVTDGVISITRDRDADLRLIIEAIKKIQDVKNNCNF